MLPDRVIADDFAEFFRIAEPRLRVALCSSFGIDVGQEVSAEGLAFAWEHWDRVCKTANPNSFDVCIVCAWQGSTSIFPMI